MSCARRPGAVGGGGPAAGPDDEALPVMEANAGTSRTFCQFAIPDVNTSVSASMLPLRRLAMISSCETGPTWWPPMAIYHCVDPYIRCLLAKLRRELPKNRPRAALREGQRFLAPLRGAAPSAGKIKRR